MKGLRYFRIVFGLLFLVAVTGVFVDISGATTGLLTPLLKWQFVPAMLGAATGSAGVLLCLLGLTLVFGRVYCSFLCPAGIFQDVVTTVAKLFKSKRSRRYTYARPHRWLRYGLLTASLAALLLGEAALLLWLDPYSNYGRMAENVFRAGATGLNNIGASAFPETFYRISYTTFTWGSIAVGALFLAVLTGLSAWRGRLYCNTVCPVGSLLGLVSKYALFRVGIRSAACTHCRLCERSCKAQCVDGRTEQLDVSRCVQCYTCTTVCKSHAIGLRFGYARKPRPVQAGSRRLFLASAGMLASAAVARAWLPHPHLQWRTKNTKAIAPPGAQSIDHLKQHCTGCHACVAKCPSKVVRPALGEYGLDGVMMPVMDYRHAFCNYTCTECSRVCPSGALLPLTEDAKKTTQIGKAMFKAENCIVLIDETDCGACDEHCPTKAVHMVDFRDGLLIPEVDTSLCIGCGGCEYICPGRPDKAIVVQANPTHLTAHLPPDEKQEAIEVDFGF
ncbi:MAG: 4Fe-4S dicluster domain-containing protein [Prevotellaceae bacterium]|jgi:ferredoxin|nr:4Fe-4S dicluster domain-containing protein [Prevotellaceae bacterium]